MIAFVTLLVAIGIAAGIGFGVRRLARRVRSPVLRWVLSAAAAFVVFLASASYLLYRGVVLPAADDSIFRDREAIEIALYASKSSANTQALVKIERPQAVRIRDESAVDLVIDGPGSTLPTGVYEATLETGENIRVRTSSACPGSQLESSVTAVRSCRERQTRRDNLSFRWFIRSSETSQSYVTLKLPRNMPLLQQSKGASWFARVDLGGNLFSSSLPVRGRTKLSASPIILSAEHPVLREWNLEIDLRSQQITFPIVFQTTLGISGSAYERLTVVGAVMSGLLGGGWLWQLLEWLKSRREKRPAAVLVRGAGD